MDINLTVILVAVAVILVILTVLLLLVMNRKKDKPKVIEYEELKKLITSGDVKNIEFIRNKIVLFVKDGNTFDVEKLHEAGVKGMQVVGDKIKFYFDGDRNEKMFDQMKSWLEV